MLDIFGGNSISQVQPQAQTQSTMNVLDDLLGGFSQPQPAVVTPTSSTPSLISIYEDSMISIGVTMKKEPSDNTTHLIRAFFVNKSSQALSQLNMQVAV